MDTFWASDVQVAIGTLPAAVTYAGPQGSFIGLDQVNVVMPQSLAGSRSVPLDLAVGGLVANV